MYDQLDSYRFFTDMKRAKTCRTKSDYMDVGLLYILSYLSVVSSKKQADAYATTSFPHEVVIDPTKRM